MKIKVQIVIENEYNESPVVNEIACIQRGNLLPETLGLSLSEGREMLAGIQKSMIYHQVEEYIEQYSHCQDCGFKRKRNGVKEINYRTLFGKIGLSSQRFQYCSCELSDKKSFSPLAEKLSERTSPELLYLESKWASLMSYGLTVKLLEEVLPLKTNSTTVQLNTKKVAERIEKELKEERAVFIDGCENQWEQLPDPGPPLTVGIDGGYVHARDGDNRKAGWFEVIVGKSMQEDTENKRFGFVTGYDDKPKRRLYEMLMSQGFQMNQSITFLSDGGDNVRDLQLYMSPNAEHLLDWFHVTMRITVLKQMIKGLPKSNEDLNSLEEDLERIKWYLWHGNCFNALQLLEDMDFLLEGECFESKNRKLNKLSKTVSEFCGYISNNRNFIPNYQDRYHYGEPISTAFVESTVNEVVSRRMVKKQQMRWTKRGAHLMLQVRTKTLNNELKAKFKQWYPGFQEDEETDTQKQAA